MNLPELKAEANALGYSITKKITYEKLLRCPCGNSRWVTSQLAMYGKKYYRCSKCGYTGEPAKFKYQAIINWNKMASDIKQHREYMNQKTEEFINKLNELYKGDNTK